MKEASVRIILWDDHAIIFRSHEDHHRIVDAVLGRDGARAEHLMREHVYFAGLVLGRSYERSLDLGRHLNCKPVRDVAASKVGVP